MAKLYLYLDKRATRKDGKAILKIALTHKHKTVYYSTDIHVSPDEWDPYNGLVVGRPDSHFLNAEICKLFARLQTNLNRLEVKKGLELYSVRDVLDYITAPYESTIDSDAQDRVFDVFEEYISLCRKKSTAQVMKTSLNILRLYWPDIEDLRFRDINVAWLKRFQYWLLDERKMEVNGANVYLRNLRAVFNYALQNEYTTARYPFKDIDMSTTDPDKRLIPYEDFIKWATLPMPDGRNFYRDLFLLSFYLCGIRPVDLLHVKKDQVQGGRLVYCPQKLNGRTKLSIKIEPEAWEIIKRYEGQEYLINVMESRSDYRTFTKHWNAGIRAIGEDTFAQKKGCCGQTYTTVKHNPVIPFITVYYARTCWATYAYNILGLPTDTISQALGHKNGLRVTNFYIKRDTERVDKANRDLIDRVRQDMEKSTKKTKAASA